MAHPLGRLSSGRAFDAVYEQGAVYNGPLFVLRVLPNASGEVRWGFAVGKRIAPLSTQRNRARRRLREAARGFLVRPGNDLIVTVKAAGLDAPYEDLVAGLERLLQRAGALEEAG